MPTRLQVLIPIGIAALIVGVAGVATLPAEVKLEQVEFPRGTITVSYTHLTLPTIYSV